MPAAQRLWMNSSTTSDKTGIRYKENFEKESSPSMTTKENGICKIYQVGRSPS